ncbi:MAG: AI-2E family transporter [Desulfuromonadaceae bacterium]|nr:AI-2E family transporter [Desulfuromonas sp.]MDY0184811.1 AI-2E family transporter [Desulfuromonadaceae bacterium]
MTSINPRPGQSILITGACLIVILAGLKNAQQLVVPFFLATFIAILCLPALKWLEKKRVPGVVAVLLVITMALLFGLILALFIGTSVRDFTLTLPTYQEQIREETKALFTWLNNYGISISSQVVLDYFDPSAAMKIAANTLSSLGSALTNGFLIMLTVVFILLEVSTMPDKLKLALPQSTASLENFTRITLSVQRYLAMKTILSAITGVIITLSMLILDVDYAVLWGLLAFLLNYIPNIGSIIAAIPAILLALIQHGIFSALFVGGVYIVVNVVIGNVVEPRFMGSRLGLSPLVVFASLVFWGWVLGPVGMLLSVPLTMILKIALEATEEWRWLAVLLS